MIPVGIVLVNGCIRSLGGGYVDSFGHISLACDEEIPCLLDGVNLTIISSDEITLSSHLIHQGVQWRDGIPYIKKSESMLNIFASGKDFVSGAEKAGQISVGRDAPQDIKIQASLTASNKGMTIKGEDKTVHLLGSLQVSDYVSNGSKLKIKSDERFLSQEDLLAHTPRSVEPILRLTSLKVLAWHEK